jgi:hypothetical protein
MLMMRIARENDSFFQRVTLFFRELLFFSESYSLKESQ